MQTKSNIQIIRENLAIRDTFKNNLQSLMDKWLIEDSYFSPSRLLPGKVEGDNKGYFVFEHEYNTLDEAVFNMMNDHSIRIINNKRFQIGKVFKKLSEAKGDKVIDITTGDVIMNTGE